MDRLYVDGDESLCLATAFPRIHSIWKDGRMLFARVRVAFFVVSEPIPFRCCVG